MSHCWIGNRAVTGEGEPVELHAPWSGELIASFREASSKQIETAIEQANKVFPAYAKMPLYQRRDLLTKLVSLLEEHREEFATAIALEAAKPIRDARGEVTRAIATFRLAVEECVRSGDGEYLTLDRTQVAHGRSAIVKKFPRGIVLGITPFNFPLNLAAHKVAPALAAGCPIILKPAPQCPSVALMLAEKIAEAGFPESVMQVIPCDGKVIEPFVSDHRIRFVSFTGSAAVGWKLKRLTGAPVALELGGNGAVLIDETADFEYAAKRCTIGGYSYAGQVCISVQRIFVVENKYSEFVSQYRKQVEKLVLNDPLSDTSDLSCMISEAAAKRVEDWMNEAVKGGAKIELGGSRTGNRLPPYILTNVPSDCRLSREEAFGPVTCISPVTDWEAGLAAINDSKYGLQAGYFTTDLNRTLTAFERLQVGGLVANDIPTFREDSYPYGGVKESGAGREGVRYAMEEMMERRVLVFPPVLP